MPVDVRVVATPARTSADVEPAMKNFARQPNRGLILPTDSFTSLRLKPV
jgi:hypothetical protein